MTIPELETPSLEPWFKEMQESLAIEVVEVGLSGVEDWRIEEVDGAPHHIGHVSGRYHRGVFLRAWDQARELWVERFLVSPIPPEQGEPIYGLALLARYGTRYLLQAKAEPGNATPGHVQLTTTIQASHTNIAAKLSGAIPFVYMFDDPKCRAFLVSQDGAQLYMKKNKVSVLELSQEPTDIPHNYAWATREDIRHFAAQGLLSEHVLQCLGAEVLTS